MKPIDILSKNLNGSEDFDIEINEPYMVFKVNISLSFSCACVFHSRNYILHISPI